MNSGENNNQSNVNTAQNTTGVPETFVPNPVGQGGPSLFANEPNTPSQPVASPQSTPSASPQSVAPAQPAQPAQPLPQTPVQQPVSPVTPAPTAAPSPEVPTPPSAGAATQEELTVINNSRNKTGGFAIIVIIGLVILFIFNIDYFIELYDEYMVPKIIDPSGGNEPESSDNLVGGYLLIGNSETNMTLDNIKFYNFKKSDNTSLTYSYVSSEKYNDASTLNLYIEVYDADKNLLYRTKFVPEEVVEKDTVSTKPIKLENDVYDSMFYALIKKIDSQANKESTKLTCTLEDEDSDVTVKYVNTYNFSNGELASYEVSKKITTKPVDDSGEKDYSNNKFVKELKSENEEVSKEFTTTYDTYSLEYKVDYSKEIIGFIPLYTKGTTTIRIKNKEQLKKWKCE